MSKVLVICLEGIPGSGKTTLKNSLVVDGLVFERIEQILPNNPESDKGLNLNDVIKSDLLKTSRINVSHANVVTLDRYYLSTLAYQFAFDIVNQLSTSIPLKELYNEALIDGRLVEPNITFFIDTPVKESFARKERRSGNELWLQPSFLEENNNYYRSLKNLYVIDGQNSLGDIKLEIESVIRNEM